jgi:hypothetical protein
MAGEQLRPDDSGELRDGPNRSDTQTPEGPRLEGEGESATTPTGETSTHSPSDTGRTHNVEGAMRDVTTEGKRDHLISLDHSLPPRGSSVYRRVNLSPAGADKKRHPQAPVLGIKERCFFPTSAHEMGGTAGGDRAGLGAADADGGLGAVRESSPHDAEGKLHGPLHSKGCCDLVVPNQRPAGNRVGHRPRGPPATSGVAEVRGGQPGTGCAPSMPGDDSSTLGSGDISRCGATCRSDTRNASDSGSDGSREAGGVGTWGAESPFGACTAGQEGPMEDSTRGGGSDARIPPDPPRPSQLHHTSEGSRPANPGPRDLTGQAEQGQDRKSADDGRPTTEGDAAVDSSGHAVAWPTTDTDADTEDVPQRDAGMVKLGRDPESNHDEQSAAKGNAVGDARAHSSLKPTTGVDADTNDSPQWQDDPPFVEILRLLGTQPTDEAEVDVIQCQASSGASGLLVYADGHRHVVRGSAQCKEPLAPIATDTVDLPKWREICQDDWDDDTELMFRWLTTSDLADALDAHVGEAARFPSTPSRHFDERDCGIVDSISDVGPTVCEGHIFKVPKTNGSRLVWDGRSLNELIRQAGLRLPSMGLPRLEEVTEAALKFPTAAAVDAASYFFQFEIAPQLRRYTGFRIAARRGHFRRRRLRRLPMGASFAPIAAQRFSNALVATLRRRLAKLGLGADDFAILAWVDNFLMFGRDMDTLRRVEHEFRCLCGEVNLTTKETEWSCQGVIDIIGFRAILGERVSVTPQHREKLLAAITTATARGALRLAGEAMWGGAVARLPLCFFQEALDAIRSACSVGLRSGWDSPVGSDIMAPIVALAKTMADASLTSKETEDFPVRETVIWTDASGEAMAGILEDSGVDRDMFTVTHDTDNIYLAEMGAVAIAAARWRPMRGTTLACDNQAVVQALRKGHSRNRVGDALLRLCIPLLRGVYVAWVPTDAQRADPLTRGVPVPRTKSTRPCGQCPRWRLPT